MLAMLTTVQILKDGSMLTICGSILRDCARYMSWDYPEPASANGAYSVRGEYVASWRHQPEF
jgi:hypothetical protein